MSRGLETTFRVLTQAGSQTADRQLLSALESPERRIQEGALLSLLNRRVSQGPSELIRRWSQLSARWKSLIVRKAGRCSAAVREAVLSNDAAVCTNGCAAGIALREYDLVPDLINNIENIDHPQRELLIDTLMGLIESLYDELAGRRDYRIRRDPHQVRQHVLHHLEESMGRFSRHRTWEIIEGFLVLVNRENCTFRNLLQNPRDSTHSAIVERMIQSPRPGVMRLILSCLDDSQVPRAALKVIAKRQDIAFIRHLLRKIASEPEVARLENLARMGRVDWLHSGNVYLAAFTEREQVLMVKLGVSLQTDQRVTLALLSQILHEGKPSGRAAAAAALAEFRGPDINEIVMHGLEDSDPQVRANFLLQLRDRGIPGAIDKLTLEIDSPDEAVRAAVRSALSDFSFSRYMSAFEKLAEDIQTSTGHIVVKIDPTAIESLTNELVCDVRNRRLRAIAMTVAMGCATAVEDALHGLFKEPDQYIRLAAVNALANCRTAKTLDALWLLARDDYPPIREAAEQLLRELEPLAITELQAPPTEPLPIVENANPEEVA